jgi:hypothetical protein
MAPQVGSVLRGYVLEKRFQLPCSHGFLNQTKTVLSNLLEARRVTIAGQQNNASFHTIPIGHLFTKPHRNVKPGVVTRKHVINERDVRPLSGNNPLLQLLARSHNQGFTSHGAKLQIEGVDDVGVVINRPNPEPHQRLTAHIQFGDRSSVASVRGRDPKNEVTPLAYLRMQLEFQIHELVNPAHTGEAQTDPPRAKSPRIAQLHEIFKDASLISLRNARTRVANVDTDLVALSIRQE